MPILRSLDYRHRDTISISKDGSISFTKALTDKLGIKPGDHLVLDLIASPPFTLLFACHEDGQKVTYTTRSEIGSSGIKFRPIQILAEIMIAHIALPQRRIRAVPIDRDGYIAAAFAEPFPWITLEFTRGEWQSIPSDQLGLYELLDRDLRVVRIGEGNLRQRIDEHLKNTDMMSVVKACRYIPCHDKAESQLWEHILLRHFLKTYGTLPRFNARTH